MLSFRLSDVEYIVICECEVYFFDSESAFVSFMDSLEDDVDYKVYDLT